MDFKLKKNLGIIFLFQGVTSPILSDTPPLTEAIFLEEVQRFNRFVPSTFGIKIHFSKDWSDTQPRLSADALSRSGKVIRISGFDFQSKSLGAFRLAVCHEIGHYLGGPPFFRIDSTSIESTMNLTPLSTEGQADYFSSYCLKKYLDFFKLDINENASELCQNKPKCEYIVNAAIDLIHYLSHSNKDSKENLLRSALESLPSTRTLDQFHEYPEIHCRLHTMVNGALCENDELSPSEFVCTSGKGIRPSCWFSEPLPESANKKAAPDFSGAAQGN